MPTYKRSLAPHRSLSSTHPDTPPSSPHVFSRKNHMQLRRVGALSPPIKPSLISEAYKSKADLEVQLQLVISNNEMLEEALKQDPSGHARE